MDLLSLTGNLDLGTTNKIVNVANATLATDAMNQVSCDNRYPMLSNLKRSSQTTGAYASRALSLKSSFTTVAGISGTSSTGTVWVTPLLATVNTDNFVMSVQQVTYTESGHF